MKSISLTQLFSSLLNSMNRREYVKLPDAEVVPTTVRLDPDVREFYTDAANELGLSLQSMINVVLSGVMKVSLGDAKSEMNLLLDRFFYLFKSNNIPVADIPTFLGESKISLSTLTQTDRLLDALTPDVLQRISALFCVNSQWLKGVDSSSLIYPTQKWYKSPSALCHCLNELSHDGKEPEVIFISDSSVTDLNEDKKSEAQKTNVGVVIKLSMQTPTGMSYDYFKIFEYESWGYEKARMCLKVLMLFCIRNHFHLSGAILNKNDFTKLFHGEDLPINLLQKKIGVWDPIDYVSIGFMNDKDTDEFRSLIQHYCEFYKIKENYDGKGSSGRSHSFHQFCPKIDLYDPNDTDSIERIVTASLQC